MKVLHLTGPLLALLPTLACDLTGADTGTPAADTGTATTPEPSSTETDSTPDDTGGDDGNDSGAVDSSGGDTGSADDSTGGMPVGNCETATLLMGNPYFDGDFGNWNASGQPLLADPPLRSRHLANVGGKVAIETQFEVWGADAGEVFRIAGDEEEFETQYQPSGPCADVRILIGYGIAGLPGNRLAVADTRGNGVIELTDPFGTCTAAPIAGTQTQVFDVDISNGAANPGDQDGPGAQALFFGPERLTSDSEGNLYVVDSGNAAIKRIADDADRTVTTLHRFDGAKPRAMSVMDGTLYVVGVDGNDDFVWSIDPETGTQTEIFAGRGLLDEVDSSRQLGMFALENDGVDLLVGSAEGYLFRLSTAAEPLGIIAGFGSVTDFPTDLDLTMPIPVAELPIHSYGLGDASLLRVGTDLLFTNVANGIGFHVWSIDCE